MLSITYINPDYPDTGGWKKRHRDAITRPRGIERPIVAMLGAWIEYAQHHEQRHGANIGDDSYLGPIWSDLGQTIHRLLDGETGRLDCGTLSHIIHTNRTAVGLGE